MKWGNENREHDWLNTYPQYEISPRTAASIMTLGISWQEGSASKSIDSISEVKGQMPKSIDSIAACPNIDSITACANCGVKCFKNPSVLKTDEGSDLSFVYFALSFVMQKSGKTPIFRLEISRF